MAEIFWDSIDTIVGPLSFCVDGDGRVVGVRFGRVAHGETRASASCAAVREQLQAYFDGNRERFELELSPTGTAFQRRVWQGLTDIPFGEAWSYGELARHIGKPGAARAVGQANGRNPIPVIIPCHRVISADRSIGGFASGLDVKRKLLALERIELAA